MIIVGILCVDHADLKMWPDISPVATPTNNVNVYVAQTAAATAGSNNDTVPAVGPSSSSREGSWREPDEPDVNEEVELSKPN